VVDEDDIVGVERRLFHLAAGPFASAKQIDLHEVDRGAKDKPTLLSVVVDLLPGSHARASSGCVALRRSDDTSR
jgi:hypothetical protein